MNRRWGVAVATGALGLVTLAGCGAAGTGSDAAGSATSTGSTGGTAGGSAEEQALSLVGLGYHDGAISDDDTTDVSDPSASGSPAPGSSSSASAAPDRKRGHHPRLRRYVRKHTLHGDITVKTKKGTVTIAVQRGSITAVSGTSMTVKSSDGFTETWTLTSKTGVRADHKKGSVNSLHAGDQIGVAGRQDGKTDTARLVFVVPAK